MWTYQSSHVDKREYEITHTLPLNNFSCNKVPTNEIIVELGTQKTKILPIKKKKKALTFPFDILNIDRSSITN